MNKKILTGPFFKLFFFLHFHDRFFSLPFFPFSFLPFSPALSPLLKLRSWPGVKCRSRPGVELDLDLGGVLISTWGGARSGFRDLVGFLVGFTGRLEWVDGFFEVLDFELILEEEW